ncbi:hypothetical protein PG991_009232 [Apiospora marii]|uniref:Uncharacterized protein n=1 Tax=Apiospora marii TaxID=335849 RepID=A0ABR1RM67_9PEZI
MCTSENITINSAHEAHGLPIMTLPQTNDQAHQLEADYHSFCFDFSYHGLSLELEQLGSEGIMSILPPWTEDQTAGFFFSKPVAPITPLPLECLDGNNLEGSILDDMLYFLEQNPAECGDKWGMAWDELFKAGLGHDETTIGDTVQAHSLSSARSRGQSLGGVGHVNGFRPAQDDPEDSVSLEASPPQEHRAWSRPDPAVSMSMEEAASEVPAAELSRNPCGKRKARQIDNPRPFKRARGHSAGSTRHKVSVRLVEVVFRITPVAQHFCWKRRCALWDDGLGQESWTSEDLSCYVLAGLPFLSLVVRPSGYGFPVPLAWDEESHRFSGYNAMNRKWLPKALLRWVF